MNSEEQTLLLEDTELEYDRDRDARIINPDDDRWQNLDWDNFNGGSGVYLNTYYQIRLSFAEYQQFADRWIVPREVGSEIYIEGNQPDGSIRPIDPSAPIYVDPLGVGYGIGYS